MQGTGAIAAPFLDVAIQRKLGAFTLDCVFSARRGVTALFGASGAGKTTIANAIAGIVTPDAGHVRIAGEALFDSSSAIDVPVERRGVGYVFQDARLFPHLRVEGNLRFGASRTRGRASIASFDAVVDVLAIRPLLQRRPRDLSGGERQRVALGRALLAQPRLLILDEPLAALDAGHRHEILPYLVELAERFALPMIYVSHAIDEVVRLATDVVLVADGRVVASGPVEEIFSRGDLRPHTGRRFEAGSIVEATKAGQRPEWKLTEVLLAGSIISVPAVDAAVGTRLRIRIRARDVALALSEPLDTSIGARLPGVISEVVLREAPYAEVRVDLGNTSLWALVTRHSVDRLRLAPGRSVYCLVKTVALDSRLVGPAPAALPQSGSDT